MTILRRLLCVAVSSVCLMSASAQEGYYLGVAVGSGEVNIDQDTFANAALLFDDTSGAVVVAEFSGGYKFTNNLTVDLSYETYDSFDIFIIGNSIDVSNFRIGGGYHFPSEGKFSGFVKAGVSFWDLSFTESLLFNPGPEETGTRDGNDLYLQVGLELKSSFKLTSRLTYDYSDTGFGSTSAVKVWLGWTF